MPKGRKTIRPHQLGRRIVCPTCEGHGTTIQERSYREHFGKMKIEKSFPICTSCKGTRSVWENLFYGLKVKRNDTKPQHRPYTDEFCPNFLKTGDSEYWKEEELGSS